MEYSLGKKLGSGAYGSVYRAKERSTGRVVAVKIMRRSDTQSWHAAWIGEGIILQNRLSHDHIIKCFHTEGWESAKVRIVMELMHGDLDSLVDSNRIEDGDSLAQQVLHEMLQALDYLAHLGYVHRDVKPGNIFYKVDWWAPDARPHRFKLGDFGLCCHESSISDVAGTERFMAPELLARPRLHRQSHKSDVWALYVTILWILDRSLFQYCSTGNDIVKAVEWTKYDGKVSRIQEMANADPVERATAAQMLVKRFKGVGLAMPLYK